MTCNFVTPNRVRALTEDLVEVLDRVHRIGSIRPLALGSRGPSGRLTDVISKNSCGF